jgi:AraC-like DNA-binding protein
MSTREALAALIERFTPSEGVNETCCGPRMSLYRVTQPSDPVHAVHEPSLCILVQGRKRVLAGNAVHHYGPNNYFLAAVDVPVVGQVIEASPQAPYLCFRMTLDPAVISELMMEAGLAARFEAEAATACGLAVGLLNPSLIDATLRMVRLLERPEDASILAPLIEREILYRVMTDEHGARLAQIARADGRLRQVNRAIGWIKRNFDQPFRIEAVAEEARMSVSTLHQHFKAVTALSPLQYQKQLRLQEARRLIVIQRIDAAAAGHAVGYDSASQFSREYARLFGAPPLRDAARLRDRPDLVMEA